MILLVDKPKGITSHDVVDRVRRITGEKRVGHAGTLDPLATGLLIVGVGRESTKQLGAIAIDTDKTYKAEIMLGQERSTDDSEGEVIFENDDKKPSIDQIEVVLKKFIGNIEQIPPSFSAIKLQGRKSYDMARRGEVVIHKPRAVVIHSIEIESFEYPILTVVCRVSSGTYIRALARDIGRELGTGAYLSNLRRTKIGEFDVSQAKLLEEMERDTFQ